MVLFGIYIHCSSFLDADQIIGMRPSMKIGEKNDGS